MNKISLTDFVDIVSASGTPKATKVRQIKRRPAYEPAFDFYKQLREGIIANHQEGLGKREVNRSIGPLTDDRKRENYAAVVSGYKKWWGRKDLQWFEPPSGTFEAHGIGVRVNPELGLSINGRRHLVKLYFKADKLTKNKIDLITHIMETSLTLSSEVVMAVLDCRRSKLISPTVPIKGLDGTLRAELAYVAALWNE